MSLNQQTMFTTKCGWYIDIFINKPEKQTIRTKFKREIKKQKRFIKNKNKTLTYEPSSIPNVSFIIFIIYKSLTKEKKNEIKQTHSNSHKRII